MKKVTKKHLLSLPQFISGFDYDQSVFHSFEVNGLKDYYFNSDTKPDTEQVLKDLNKEFQILYADYTYEDYSGDAYVLGFNKLTNKFFEVHGSHCSCYGLEGQWSPEECTLEELNELIKRRFEEQENSSYYYRNANASVEFKKWLEGNND